MPADPLYEVLRVQAFFTALPLAFGFLHLMLWRAMPRLRSNLYYGLFLLAIAATIFFDFQDRVQQGSENALPVLSLHRAFLSVAVLFVVRFLHEAFTGGAPRHFRFTAAALLVAGAVAAFSPNALFWPLQIALVLAFADGVRVAAAGIRKKREDALLLAGGYFTFLAFATYDLLLDFGLIPAIAGVQNAYQAGLIGLFVATSAYLARSMARTQTQLVTKERQVQEREIENRVLEAEVGRTRAELEEARTLQLSMLPSSLPRRRGVQVAVHMSTALEVGGDYYDFREGHDGTLTVAIGDATGHGLRAGFMVAVAKSLFHGLRDDEGLPDFFNRCTGVLKQMRLGNLFMALTLVRVRAEGLTIAAAGMPPALLYRASRGEVEGIALRGMPLGAFANFAYQHAWVPFGSGDVLLLMTDGLPELFDAAREQLGAERIIDAFSEAASESPDAIVERLRALGASWRGEVAPADDVTIVVLKATGPDPRVTASHVA